MTDEMADQKPGDEQAQFIWSKKPKGLAKLFMKKADRRKLQSGRHLHFLVYSWGFRRIDGDKELSGRWEEVAALSQFVMKFTLNGAHTRTDCAYWGRLADGRPFGFSGSLWPAQARDLAQAGPPAVTGATTPVNVGQLGRIFTARVGDALLPGAISRFDAGQTATFGPFTVGPAGIAKDGESAAWDEIENVRTHDGFVRVKKTGTRRAWQEVPQPQVPNDFVFEALARTVLARRTGDGPAT